MTPTTDKMDDLVALRDLARRAQDGDATARNELRQIMAADSKCWRQAGDLAVHAELALLTKAAGEDLLAREAIAFKLTSIKADLGHASAPPLEKLLIDRIALSWLAVHGAELGYVSLRDGEHLPRAVDQARRRLDSAHRRYLSAIKQLAVVRKLLKPALSPLQVAQVELAGGGRAGLGRRQTTCAVSN